MPNISETSTIGVCLYRIIVYDLTISVQTIHRLLETLHIVPKTILHYTKLYNVGLSLGAKIFHLGLEMRRRGQYIPAPLNTVIK